MPDETDTQLATTTPVVIIPEVNNQERRVYNLTVDLHRMKQDKKAAVRGFNDEIKRLESEIKDILKGDGNGQTIEE